MRKDKKNRHIGMVWTSLIMLAVCLAVPASMTAQGVNWQYVYGNDPCQDEGRFRVIPIAEWNDLPAGYLAVGWSFVEDDCSMQRTYVVRTDLNGARVWEFTYDIGFDGLDDFAHSVVVGIDSDGQQVITVTGSALTEVGTFDAYLMQLDCDGNVLWSNTYGGNDDEFGNDIIQAANGDFVVAGASATIVCPPPFGPDLDAWLFRTDGAGNLLWDVQYNQGEELNEWFWALTELGECAGGIPAGDILAVGWRDNPGFGRDGYAVRVDGATGFIIAAPQNAATYGGRGDQEFYSVIELQNPALNGGPFACQDAVIAGETTDLNGNIDIYLVRLAGADPCNPAIQTQVGDPFAIPGDARRDWARTIREVPVGPADPTTCQVVSQWDLILTGATDQNTPGDLDLILLGINPTFLVPTGLGWQYDPNPDTELDDEGWSLAPTFFDAGYDGAIMCGYTDSDPLNVGDPRDLYLLKSDCPGNAGVGCQILYKPRYTEVPDWECIKPEYCRINRYEHRETGQIKRDWGKEVCHDGTVDPTLKELPGFSESGSGADVLLSPDGALRYYPNPVHRGQRLNLEFAPAGEEDVTVRVMNTLGELVTSVAHDNSGDPVQIPVATGAWNSGSYLVEVSDGMRSATIRIVVIE